MSYQLDLPMLTGRGRLVQGASTTRRGSGGERYGASFRHVTPHVDYARLDVLLPVAGALCVTVLREPLARFVSAFNFVKTTAQG